MGLELIVGVLTTFDGVEYGIVGRLIVLTIQGSVVDLGLETTREERGGRGGGECERGE